MLLHFLDVSYSPALGASNNEAIIVGTTQSSVYRWNEMEYPASMLVDGLYLDGVWSYENGGCAATHGNGTQWFSLELENPGFVTKVQIARCMDGYWEQGQNISISIGPSKEYDPNEPLCLPEIPELTREAGLVDYGCNPGQEGKFLKISTPNSVMALCEVKVFVRVQGKNFAYPSISTYLVPLLY